MSFVCLGGGGHEARFVPFVCRHVKQIRMPSSAWGSDGGGAAEGRFVSFVCLGGGSHEARFVSFVCQPYEADSYAFSTGVGQAVGKRRIGISRLHHARTAGITARVVGHEARFVSFVVSTTKKSRAPLAGFG